MLNNRAKRAKSSINEPKESQIVTAICNFLQYEENKGNLYFIRNNTGAFATQPLGGNRRFVRYGKVGTSDIIIFMSSGRTIFVEVKTATGKQNDNQKAFEQKITALGFEYHIVRDVEKVVWILGYK
jgi:Holliday junction resolvase-like predicted endonuclease